MPDCWGKTCGPNGACGGCGTCKLCKSGKSQPCTAGKCPLCPEDIITHSDLLNDLSQKWAVLKNCLNQHIFLLPNNFDLNTLPKSTDAPGDFKVKFTDKHAKLVDIECPVLEQQIIRYFMLLIQMADQNDNGTKACGKLFLDLMQLQDDGHDWLTGFMAPAACNLQPNPACKGKGVVCDLPQTKFCDKLDLKSASSTAWADWGKCAQAILGDLTSTGCKLNWSGNFGAYKNAKFYTVLQDGNAKNNPIIGKFDEAFGKAFGPCRSEFWAWGAWEDQFSKIPGIYGTYTWDDFEEVLGLPKPPGQFDLTVKPPWEITAGKAGNPRYFMWAIQKLMAMFVLKKCGGKANPFDVDSFDTFLPQWALQLPKFVGKDPNGNDYDAWCGWALLVCGLPANLVKDFLDDVALLRALDPELMCAQGWNGLNNCVQLCVPLALIK